jgi:hypothetical protein
MAIKISELLQSNTDLALDIDYQTGCPKFTESKDEYFSKGMGYCS